MPARVWFAMDAMFTHDPAIQRLGMEFGPAGPLTIAHLLGVAKLHDRGGAFEIHWRALANAVYVDDVSVTRAIVTEASRIGFLGVTAHDDKVVAGHFPGWAQWQPERALARERQRRHRAKTEQTSGESPVGDAIVTDGVTAMSRTERDKNVPTDTGTDTGTDKEEKTYREHPDFGSWLTHHESVTGRRPPRPGTMVRRDVAAMYSARRAEGYTAEDACHATLGAFNDEWRRQNGHIGCESVLRPKKFHDLVERGRAGRPVVPTQEHPASRRIRELEELKQRLAAEEEANAA